MIPIDSISVKRSPFAALLATTSVIVFEEDDSVLNPFSWLHGNSNCGY